MKVLVCQKSEHAKGALANLVELSLGGNEIGDAGISALASACASGALPKCNSIKVVRSGSAPVTCTRLRRARRASIRPASSLGVERGSFRPGLLIRVLSRDALCSRGNGRRNGFWRIGSRCGCLCAHARARSLPQLMPTDLGTCAGTDFVAGLRVVRVQIRKWGYLRGHRRIGE